MWLVLCEDHDLAARWAYTGLLARGLVPLEIVMASALAASPRWVHRVGSAASDVEVRLPDGRVLDSRRVRGCLNRLTSAWNPRIAAARPGDQEYARGEWYAFLVSSLHCLQGAPDGSPNGQSLSGRWRHPAEWTLLAARAGFATAPCRVPATAPGPAPAPGVWPGSASRRTLIVVGGRVVGAGTDRALEEAARRLGALSEDGILGVDLAWDPAAGWRFAAATPHPDLRVGGGAVLDALAAYLRDPPGGSA